MSNEVNGAKMREVMDELKNTANSALTALSVGNCPSSLLWDIVRKCDAVLSTPARNCDRFVDELDAQIEFLNDVWRISVTKDTMLERDKFENWTEEMKSRYAKWLFAEVKGNNNVDE